MRQDFDNGTILMGFGTKADFREDERLVKFAPRDTEVLECRSNHE